MSRRPTIYLMGVTFCLALITCKTDYRTDYERDNGITLTPEQIAIRKFNREQKTADFVRESKRLADEMRMRRLLGCHADHYLRCW